MMTAVMAATPKPTGDDAPGSILEHPAHTEAVERIRVLEESVGWQEQRFRAVMDIARALGQTFDLDDLLRIIMERTTALMDAERSTLFLVDPSRKEVWSKVLSGNTVSEERIRVPMGKGIVGWVAQTGGVVNVPDAYQDERFNPEVDKETGYRTRSILCVPMFDQRQQVIGAVQVLNKRAGVFDRDDELLLAAVVSQAAISIENSVLYRDLVARNRELVEAQTRLRHKMAELDLLYDVERQISAATRLPEVLQGILDKACEVIGAEAGSILLIEEGSGELYFKAVQGEQTDALRRLRLPLGVGVAGRVAREGRSRLVNDAKGDPDHDPSVDAQLGFETRSIIAAPLKIQDRCIGALELLNSHGGEGFHDEDLKLLILIAGQASRAIAISQAREAGERAERLSLLGQMVSGILHDLKTPMTVISGHAQLMAIEDDPDERERHAEAVLKQFDHIAAMTREIMAFAKGQREILVRKVFLHKFIDQVRDLLRPDLESHSVTLSVDARYRGAARFDETKLTRVITNLARNACQAMEGNGGGSFTWTIDHDEGAGQLVFLFKDDGPGIPLEMEGRLFDSFATHGKSDGTGLGLAIVKNIIEEHGGTIGYTSESGAGTTFRITLPMT
jgi:signal transduction histidine kinase